MLTYGTRPSPSVSICILFNAYVYSEQPILPPICGPSMNGQQLVVVRRVPPAAQGGAFASLWARKFIILWTELLGSEISQCFCRHFYTQNWCDFFSRKARYLCYLHIQSYIMVWYGTRVYHLIFFLFSVFYMTVEFQMISMSHEWGTSATTRDSNELCGFFL